MIEKLNNNKTRCLGIFQYKVHNVVHCLISNGMQCQKFHYFIAFNFFSKQNIVWYPHDSLAYQIHRLLLLLLGTIRRASTFKVPPLGFFFFFFPNRHVNCKSYTTWFEPLMLTDGIVDQRSLRPQASVERQKNNWETAFYTHSRWFLLPIRVLSCLDCNLVSLF